MSAVLDHVAALSQAQREMLTARLPQLVHYLAWIPDPRDPRGVRHSLTSLLSAAIAAALSGSTSFAAISEWIADAPVMVLVGLGIRWNPLRCAHEVPDESTLRVLLEALDATAFAAVCGSRLADLRPPGAIRIWPGGGSAGPG
ncbi:transposase family protein [Nonomuraea sp. NPDC002799]